jgi:replication initiation protein RepC
VPTSREDWLRLVEAIAPRLGLGDKALRALRVIVTACRWADFAEGGPPPVCFRQQQRMAEAIGVTPGHFRKLEARLEAAGLIERRTCENGHRGRMAPGADAPVAGLSLAPMLANLPRWRAIEEAMRREACALAEGRAMIRIERRAARHAVTGLPAGHHLRVRHDAMRGAGFRPSVRYASTAEIAAHLDELRAVIEEARRVAPPRADEPIPAGLDDTDRSGAPRPGERRHTEVPTDPQTGSCSGAAGYGRSAPSKPDCPRDRSGRSREEDGEEASGTRGDRREGGDGKEEKDQLGLGMAPLSRLPPALLDRLTPAVLRELGSDELRLYVDHLEPRPHGAPPTLRDVERAALMRRREMGITPAAWEEVEAALGWLDALVALVVVDANREHPKTPVRNPGGLLRDLARRRRAGTLDLAASVMGVWRRVGDGSS